MIRIEVKLMARKLSQSVTIPATKAHRQFDDLLRRAHSGEEHFVVEQDDLPVAVILSVAEYEALIEEHDAREMDRQERLRKFRQATREIGEEVARLGLTEEDVMRITDEVRQERYERKHGHPSRE
jgi:prevent-host-death family protein